MKDCSEAHVETSATSGERRNCPLYAAVRGGHSEAVSRLIAGVNPNDLTRDLEIFWERFGRAASCDCVWETSHSGRSWCWLSQVEPIQTTTSTSPHHCERPSYMAIRRHCRNKRKLLHTQCNEKDWGLSQRYLGRSRSTIENKRQSYSADEVIGSLLSGGAAVNPDDA